MDEKEFFETWTAALDSEDRESFAQDNEELGRVWDAAHISVADIRATTGLSAAKFGARFCIPMRTIQNWDSGARSCPPYVRLMMLRILGIYDPDTTKTNKKGSKTMRTDTRSYITGRLLYVLEAAQREVPGTDKPYQKTLIETHLEDISHDKPLAHILQVLRKLECTYFPLVDPVVINRYKDRIGELLAILVDSFPEADLNTPLGDDWPFGYYKERSEWTKETPHNDA